MISLLCKKNATKTDVCESESSSVSISFDLVSFAALRTAPSAASAMFENSQQGLTAAAVTVARWATVFLRFPKEACPYSNLALCMYFFFVTQEKRRRQGQRELIRSNRTSLNPVLHCAL